MLHIAVGVFLGILAAVTVLNWWEGRHERREQRAYLRMLRAAERAARDAEKNAEIQASEAAYAAEQEARNKASAAFWSNLPIKTDLVAAAFVLSIILVALTHH